jgi:hypothetical protein
MALADPRTDDFGLRIADFGLEKDRRRAGGG